jgi:hypothetical protein
MGYETGYVQPAFERHLLEKGYYYKREVPLRLFGRADFEVHAHNDIYVVECKNTCHRLRRAILQVLGYRLQMGEHVIPVLVVPAVYITQDHRDRCAEWGVRLFGVTVSTSLHDYRRDRVFSGLTWAVGNGYRVREEQP